MAALALFIFVALLVIDTSSLEGSSLTDRQRLVADMFRNYDPKIIPLLGRTYHIKWTAPNGTTAKGDVIQVSFRNALAQIIDIDEKRQVMVAMLWVRVFWRDPLLNWDPNDYSQLYDIRLPAEMIWKPDVVAYNRVENLGANEISNVIIDSTGFVQFLYRTIVTATCEFDLELFPFDTQRCEIEFGCWSYTGSEVDVDTVGGEGDIDNYVENGEWHLLRFNATRRVISIDVRPGEMHEYPSVAYEIVLKRRSLFYVFNLVLPATVITLIALVGFFTPDSSGYERVERITLGITTLLSMSVLLLMVSDQMPASAKVLPLISLYYGTLLVVIAVATLTSSVALAVQRRGLNAHRPSPSPGVRRVFFGMLAPLLRVDVSSASASVHPDVKVSADELDAADANAEARVCRAGIDALVRRARRKDQSMQGRRQWALVADVIDRLMLVFFLAIVAGVLLFLIGRAV